MAQAAKNAEESALNKVVLVVRYQARSDEPNEPQ